MRVVCTTNVLEAQEAFGSIGDVELVPDKEITREHLLNADALVTRSTIKVNRELLDGTRVKFVGTATIGTDHLDLGYLDQSGIRWCSAAGCNANSVAEYVVCGLLCMGKQHDFSLERKTIGVVGVGNVGSLVVKKSKALGMRVIQNDPPKADESGDPVFRSLDEVLSESDIITLHAPLTKDAPHPTHRMVNDSFFERLKPGCIFINAARGPIVETDSLLRALDRGIVSHTILDTWEDEPDVRRDILERSDISTPHIAGHSLEGKLFGTVLVYRELCGFAGLEPAWDFEKHMADPVVPRLNIDGKGKARDDVLYQATSSIYDIQKDDSRFRHGAGNRPVAELFRDLRQNYPVRREFRFTEITATDCEHSTVECLRDLQFKTEQGAKK